jgi:hypothetical protein
MKIFAYFGLIALLLQDNLLVNCALRVPKTKTTANTQIRAPAVPIVTTTTQALAEPSSDL